jgi:hypothetical protein
VSTSTTLKHLTHTHTNTHTHTHTWSHVDIPHRATFLHDKAILTYVKHTVMLSYHTVTHSHTHTIQTTCTFIPHTATYAQPHAYIPHIPYSLPTYIGTYNTYSYIFTHHT